jgi:hypothetical protein
VADERRGDDGRIAQILEKVVHIDRRLDDHDGRIVESEKVLIRVQERQTAADNKFATAIKTLEDKVDGVLLTVTGFVNDFHGHTEQESKDRKTLIYTMGGLIVSIVGPVAWWVFTEVVSK